MNYTLRVRGSPEYQVHCHSKKTGWPRAAETESTGSVSKLKTQCS